MGAVGCVCVCECVEQRRGYRLDTGDFFTDGLTFHWGLFGSFTLLGIRNIICPASPPLLWPVPWFGSLGCVREAVQWWLRQHKQRAAWKLVRASAGNQQGGGVSLPPLPVGGAVDLGVNLRLLLLLLLQHPPGR